MSDTNPISFKDQLLALHQDAVIWKAKRLWELAADPDEQAMAMEQLVEMMCCIGNETKRSQYIELVQKAIKITNSLLKKRVAEFLKQQKAKKQQEIAKKKLEQQFTSADDAGLAAGYMGDIYNALKYGIYEHEGVYYTRGTKGADYPVTNFTMKILYHVDTSDEQAFRLIAVKNVYGFESFMNLNTDDFVSLGSFKKVLARRGDYIFKGTDADLSRLQEFLQKDEVKTTFIKTLGWHKRGKFFAFANGIYTAAGSFVPVDEYGIVQHDNKNYFIPAVSKMFAEKDDMFVNEKKFVYRDPVLGFGFTEWSDLFYKTFDKKSIAGILFYIGSLFRDIMMKQLQRYPILNLFGPPGAGKGQFGESLMSMFGERQDQIMLGGASTVVGFMRKFAQYANALVWLDEYKNDLPFKFIESFKNLYDGKGYERGKMTNDFATESTPIHSSCILSGQHMPTFEPALFMRVVMLSFEDGKFTNDQRRHFKELKDIEGPGLSYISASLLRHRDIIEKEYKNRQEIIFKELYKDVANTEVDDRMILNISMLLTFYSLLKDHLKFPFSYGEAKAWLIENMMHQHTILAGNNDVAKFWTVIESLFHQELIVEEKDFKLQDGYIFLCLAKVYPLYLKELKQRGDNNFLAKPTIEYYLQLDKSVFISHLKKRFEDGSNNWVYQFKYGKLNIDLIKVKKAAFESDEQHKLAIKQKYDSMGVDSGQGPLINDEKDQTPFSGGYKPIEK